MTSNRALILAILAASIVLLFSVVLVAYDVLGLRVSSVEALLANPPTITPSITPQPSYTRRPSLTPRASVSPSRSPTASPTLLLAPASSKTTGRTATRAAGTPGKRTPTPVLKRTATPSRSPSRPPASSTALATATPTLAQTNTDLEFVSVSTTTPGGNAQVTVKTLAKTICSLVYISTSGMFLEPPGSLQRADSNGNITWVWRFPADALPGQGRVVVICGTNSIESPITVERR